jgi:ATP-dependent Lhr-like helicase
MTLEIGIDIGGIDAIVLFGVPPTISTLLQRVGRGNRKSNKTVAFGVYESEGEKNLFQKMFEMARAGELERFIYKPDLSVVVQQIFSYLFQRRSGVSSEELYEIFDSFCGREIFDEIVINLKNLEFVELRVNRWHATERLMELADRGVIHSNIPDTREYQVVDITSGRHLGDIIPPGVKTFLFAGRAWEIVRVEQDTIFVKQTKKAEPPKFQKRIQHGSFFKYLPKNIRNSLDQK